jgi:hypothetical protein
MKAAAIYLSPSVPGQHTDTGTGTDTADVLAQKLTNYVSEAYDYKQQAMTLTT